MSWEVVYLPEALNDLRSLDGSQRLLVKKAIEKLKLNPLPETEGGYGKWLGNKSGRNLSGFLKVKLRGPGLRIVYQLLRIENQVLIVVIGARKDSEVYDIAHSRVKQHDL